jgi:hypothetical protein
VNIPDDAVIAREKLTDYLLIWRVENDKSRFLALAGFTIEHAGALEAAIRELNTQVPAMRESENEYGEFHSVDGHLTGVNGVTLHVTTIWLKQRGDGTFRFITLLPGGRRTYEL